VPGGKRIRDREREERVTEREKKGKHGRYREKEERGAEIEKGDKK
jgi:hypothetical protein